MSEQRKENYSYSYDGKKSSNSASQQRKTSTANVNWALLTSWPFIVGAFLLGLWPIGVFLIVKGMNLDSEKPKSKPASYSVVTKVDSANVKTTEAKAKSAQPAAKKPARKKTTKKKSSVPGLGLIIAGTILALSGLAATADTLDMILWTGSLSGYLSDLWMGLTMLTAGGGLLGSGIGCKRQAKRFPLYRNVIGSRTQMSLDEIALTMGVSRRRAVRDLRKMVEKGFFGSDAYLDMGRGVFVADGDAVVTEEKLPEAEPQKAAEGYEEILRNLRQLDERIADEALSAQIRRIEEISRKIFREVERSPEKEKQISALMNYYLPTTQKLLDSYATFEEAGVDGEKTAQAKERIETTMERIVRGFEKQLDEIYSADVMDVESDIRVMESMLRRDGADETDELQLKL